MENETRIAQGDRSGDDSLDVFRMILEMNGRNQNHMPMPQSNYNGKSDNPFLKKRT
jgi:hypothetical protein